MGHRGRRDRRDWASFHHVPWGDRGHRGRRDRRDLASLRHAPREGDGGHRGRRDRRDRGNGTPLGFAVAAVTTVIVEPRPARTLIRWGEGLAVDESVTIA